LKPANDARVRLTRLIEEARIEIEALDATAGALHRDRPSLASGEASEATLALAAVRLHRYYTAVEALLERVARLFDESIPEGPTSHRDLLQFSIRLGRWNYLEHRDSGGNDYGKPPLDAVALPERLPSAPGQLYDLESDPGETKNVHDELQELAHELKTCSQEPRRAGAADRAEGTRVRSRD
jgi:hypothetical protein